MFLTYVYSSHGANGGKANGSDPWPPAGSAVSSQLTLSSFLLGGGEAWRGGKRGAPSVALTPAHSTVPFLPVNLYLHFLFPLLLLQGLE